MGLAHPSGMRVRTILLATVLAGVGLLSPATSSADEVTAIERCPGYGAAVGVARGALAQGKNAEAVEALRRAKAALERCHREETRRTSLLAAATVSYRRNS